MTWNSNIWNGVFNAGVIKIVIWVTSDWTSLVINSKLFVWWFLRNEVRRGVVQNKVKRRIKSFWFSSLRSFKILSRGFEKLSCRSLIFFKRQPWRFLDLWIFRLFLLPCFSLFPFCKTHSSCSLDRCLIIIRLKIHFSLRSCRICRFSCKVVLGFDNSCAPRILFSSRKIVLEIFS